MPVLAHPLALLGLAALPVLLGVYLLYSRWRRREVSALFLWAGLGRQTAGRHRLRAALPPLPFWIEALLLLTLALAAAGLCWPAPGRLRPLVVILDDSVSMRAEVDGSSARERAETALRRELRRRPPTSVRLAFAGSSLRLGPRQPPQAVGAALGAWTCRQARADLLAAFSAVRSQDPEAAILVLSDRLPETPPVEGRSRWLACGLPAANAGIVHAARTARDPATDRVLFDVRSFGRLPAPVRLTVRTGSHELHRETLDPARNQHAVILSVPASAGTIVAELAPDALPADNLCTLPPAWRPRLRPAVNVQQDDLRRALERALAAVGLEPDPGADAGLVFTDGADTTSAAGAWRVRFHHLAAPAAASVEPFVMDPSHPLCDGLDLEGVIGLAGAVPGPGIPVLLAGDVPLIRDHELPSGSHHLDIALGPGRATLFAAPAWPVLVWNLLHWRARAEPGLSPTYASCGQWVPVTLARPGETARLILPDGSDAVLRPPLGRRDTGFVPEQPGLYRVESASGTFALAAVLGVADETDLQACVSGTRGELDGAALTDHGYWSSATLFGLLAALLLAVHGWLLFRQRGAGVPREAPA